MTNIAELVEKFLEKNPIKKEDWLNFQKSAEMTMRQSIISILSSSMLLTECTKRLAEFPEEEIKDVKEEEEFKVLSSMVA